jgi:putative spermidine/putrescine transport system permease protein
MLISFDNVPLSLFLAAPDAATLPVQLFTQSEQHLSSVLYAAATLTVVSSLFGITLLDRLVGLRAALRRGQSISI